MVSGLSEKLARVQGRLQTQQQYTFEPSVEGDLTGADALAIGDQVPEQEPGELDARRQREALRQSVIGELHETISEREAKDQDVPDGLRESLGSIESGSSDLDPGEIAALAEHLSASEKNDEDSPLQGVDEMDIADVLDPESQRMWDELDAMGGPEGDAIDEFGSGGEASTSGAGNEFGMEDMPDTTGEERGNEYADEYSGGGSSNEYDNMDEFEQEFSDFDSMGGDFGEVGAGEAMGAF